MMQFLRQRKFWKKQINFGVIVNLKTHPNTCSRKSRIWEKPILKKLKHSTIFFDQLGVQKKYTVTFFIWNLWS